jgi:hypothetical protein
MKQISAEERREMIAKAAYFRAEQRQFADGDPVIDWIEAEKEVGAQLDAANELLGTFQERLTITNEWVKGLRKKLSSLSNEARRDREPDLEKLAKLRDNFRRKVKQLQGKSGRAAAKARTQAEDVWDEISSTIERLGRRKIKR